MMTVTNGPWGVSTMTSSKVSYVELKVYREYEKKNGEIEFTYGDAAWKVFGSREEAEAHALERGYLKPYFDVRRATLRKICRKNWKRVHAEMERRVRAAIEYKDIRDAADWMGEMVVEMSGRILDRNWISCGVHAAARSLNPKAVQCVRGRKRA